ncbi:hypothetical protein [Pseudonocardia sp. KRD291]|uniref:hypothetical protein n=1 Tax=Pseudonocardia sp. KRD291 TaxID=2792007 RepID=UPI001C4A4BF9|nr:hypothetical protein [Pseudonocardia sp. KRD291]MBW0104545.1 hypothetical protein [Pseudonocardia sp. KRD291]
MRKLMTVAGSLAIGVVCVGGTAVASPVTPPPPPVGTAVALDGTTADGTTVAASRPLRDPVYAQCYDLLTPDGRGADWREFVNGTDRLALTSTESCTQVSSGRAGAVESLAAGERSGIRTIRSVRFSSMP